MWRWRCSGTESRRGAIDPLGASSEGIVAFPRRGRRAAARTASAPPRRLTDSRPPIPDRGNFGPVRTLKSVVAPVRSYPDRRGCGGGWSVWLATLGADAGVGAVLELEGTTRASGSHDSPDREERERDPDEHADPQPCGAECGSLYGERAGEHGENKHPPAVSMLAFERETLLNQAGHSSTVPDRRGLLAMLGLTATLSNRTAYFGSG